jgi:8-hydroxy-5-deazaflavin:NADPH oxidoreductase
VPETVRETGPLDGTIVLDAMNRFDGDPLRSTTQDLADLLPGAKLAKVFNTTGAENMATADRRATRAAMFVAGDDADAKQRALELADEIGFIAYDAGPLENAKILEDMVKVWMSISRTKGRGIAFAISES